jgi:hypothetical protein
MLNWKWEELEKNDALALAALAECKYFFSTSHVQQHLDYVSLLFTYSPYSFLSPFFSSILQFSYLTVHISFIPHVSYHSLPFFSILDFDI